MTAKPAFETVTEDKQPRRGECAWPNLNKVVYEDTAKTRYGEYVNMAAWPKRPITAWKVIGENKDYLTLVALRRKRGEAFCTSKQISKNGHDYQCFFSSEKAALQARVAWQRTNIQKKRKQLRDAQRSVKSLQKEIANATRS